MLSFSVRTHSAVCSGLQWIARTFPILSICRLHEMWIHTFSVYCERVLEWFRVLMLHSEFWSQLIFSTSKYFSDELLTEHYGSMEGKKHSHASSVFRNRQIRKSASFIRNQMILSIYFQNRAWLRTQDALYSYSSQRQGYYYEKWNNAKKKSYRNWMASCYYFFPQFCTVHQHRLLFHYCRRIFFLFFAKSHLYLFLWSKLLDFQTFIFPFVMCFFPAHSVFRVLSVVVSCKKGFHANLYRRPFEPTVYICSGLVFNILINYFTARVTFFSFSFSLFHPC